MKFILTTWCLGLFILVGIIGYYLGENENRIEKLEQQIAYYDTLFNSRMTVERERFDMLDAEVARHSTYWIQQDYWKSADLDLYLKYREAWRE